MTGTLELKDRARALEEAFFSQRESQLLEEMKKEKKAESESAFIQKLTGVTDPHVLEFAVETGLGAKTWTAITLIPMVLTAWSDGLIEEPEELKLETLGLELPVQGQGLLKLWLSRPPGEELFTLWKGFIHHLKRQAKNHHALKQLKNLILKQCEILARSSGGVLGIGSINSKEKNFIHQLEDVFKTEGI